MHIRRVAELLEEWADAMEVGDWDDVGKMLYLADALEPGRKQNGKARARLAERVPDERDQVLQKVVAQEIRRRVRAGRPVHPLTIGFWNAISRGSDRS